MTANDLATLYSLGLATVEQENELAMLTLQYAYATVCDACRLGKIRYCDVDDVVQLSAIKAMKRGESWQLGKAGWKTYVAVIARSAVADKGREYLKDKTLKEALLKEIEMEEWWQDD